MQGKKVLCKECSYSFTAQPEPAASRPEKVEPRWKGKRSGWDRPGKREPQGSPLPWVLGGIAVCFVGLLVLAGGIGFWFLVASGKAKNPHATTLSPGDALLEEVGITAEPASLPRVRVTASNANLVVDSTPVGSAEFSELKLNAFGVARPLLWAADGKSFYVLEGISGILRKVAVDGLKETRKVELGTPCSWVALSAEGVVVAANSVQAVYVLDQETLKVKSAVAVPQVRVVGSAPGLSVAYASSAEPGSAEMISVLDLTKGELVKRYRARDLGAATVGFRGPTATPDGKYLFTWGGHEQLHRFKIAGTTLTHEQSSQPIAQDGGSIAVSPDSKWVALPSGGGNYGADAYATFIYSVADLSRPEWTVNSGAYPSVVGFDPKLDYVYCQNSESPLIVFAKAFKRKEFSLPDAGKTVQFAVHPDGGSLLLLTEKKLFHVVMK